MLFLALYPNPCRSLGTLQLSPRCAESFDLHCYDARLQDAFKDLKNPKEMYLAITSEDASIVYYKISQGIVKPPV